MEQKEIAKRLIEAVDLIDFMNDGVHYDEVSHLIKIVKDLYYRLEAKNQVSFVSWLNGRMAKSV